MNTQHSCAFYAYKGVTGMAVVRPGGILHVKVDGAPRVVTRSEPDLDEEALFEIADEVFHKLATAM